MPTPNQPQEPTPSIPPSRRDFLKLIGISAAAILAGCKPRVKQDTSEIGPTFETTPDPTRSPTSQPAVKLSPSPTMLVTAETPAPTYISQATPTSSLRWPEIAKKYPQTPSRVVLSQHEAAWQGEQLNLQSLAELLDASLIALTGLEDASLAWPALFAPGEHIAIKINTIGGRVQTHVRLVKAVVEKLITTGIPADQICVYDRQTSEMKQAGYPGGEDSMGACYPGTDGDYEEGWVVQGAKIRLSRRLLDCDALINIPVLKQHGMAGVTFAMKNHYGSIDNPSALHSGDRMRKGLAELNALPPIQDKTRLIIGDVLDTAPGYRQDRRTSVGMLMMSFDPVAHDFHGLQILKSLIVDNGGNPTALEENANPWLSHGAQIGLGTNDPAHIELVEIKLP